MSNALYTLHCPHQGEMTKENCEGHIEVSRFITAAQGGSHIPGDVTRSSAGRPNVVPLQLCKPAEKNSALFLKGALFGDILKDLSLYVWTINNGVLQKSQVITLTEVVVSSFRQRATSAGLMDYLGFACKKMKVDSYTSTGTVSNSVSYDFTLN